MQSRQPYTIETWREQKEKWEKIFAQKTFSWEAFNECLKNWAEVKNFTDLLVRCEASKDPKDVRDAEAFRSLALEYFEKVFGFKMDLRNDQLPTVKMVKQFIDPTADKMVRACNKFIELIRKTLYREINKDFEIIPEPVKNPLSLYQFSTEEILDQLIRQLQSPVSAISLAAEDNKKIDNLLDEYTEILELKKMLTDKSSNPQQSASSMQAAIAKKKLKTDISKYFTTLIKAIYSNDNVNEKKAWEAIGNAIKEKGSLSSPEKYSR